ncbi:MAG: hypothetical protein AMXMBFR53_42710 [Gemmatimonadota bacterium]
MSRHPLVRAYQDAFRRDVLELVARGYAVARPRLACGLEEEVLTQYLVHAIEEELQALDLPEHLLSYITKEEAPHASGGRTGRRRRRIDIVITRTGRGRRPEFPFEAKRLNGPGSLGQYVGEDGLELFVSEAYGEDSTEAGMVGYVQVGDRLEWADQIAVRIRRDAVRLRLLGDVDSGTGLVHWRSRHQRTARTPIDVFHVLLDCA